MTSPTPPAEPADPTPTPAPSPSPLPRLPKPALSGPTPGLVPGRPVDDVAFDPSEVTSKIERRRPSAGSDHEAGEFRAPAEPLMPPTGIVVPGDLVAALRECETARRAWEDAVDAVDDYRDEARESRARRAIAIRAAGQAAARGAKRPEIPPAVSEADEEAEVAVRKIVVEARAREATAAAKKCDRITAKYAAGWAAEVVGRFGPALAAAEEAAQEAARAANAAEGVLAQAAFWRAQAIAAEVEVDGGRMTDHQRARLASDIADGAKTDLYRRAESNHRSPAQVAGELHTALSTLRGCDPAAVPPADTVGSVSVFRRIWDAASPAARQRFRNRHAGGRPMRFEQTD